jgi:hypothetical protein
MNPIIDLEPLISSRALPYTLQYVVTGLAWKAMAMYPVNIIGRDILIDDVYRQSVCRKEVGTN